MNLYLVSSLVILLVAVCHLLPTSSAADTVKTSFSGKEYIEYMIPVRHDENPKDKITLRFKTIEAYGVLLYSCGDEGDFLLLEIKRGKLVYTGSFGSVDENDGTHRLTLDTQYNDNKWHDVIVLRKDGNIYLTVDGETKAEQPKGDFLQLNLDNSFLVGGMGEKHRLDTTCHNNAASKNYIGCLEDVHFNSINLLLGANEMFREFKVHGGKLPFTCNLPVHEIIGLHSEKSSLDVTRNILIKNELKIDLTLRTFERDGHIFTHKATDGSAVLNLIGGKIKLTLSFMMLAANDAVSLDSDVVINDGDWHTIQVIIQRNESRIFLNVDQIPKPHQFESHFKLSLELGLFSSLIRFGGNTPRLPGLVSCFKRIAVDGKLVSLQTGAGIKHKNSVASSCQIKDLCFPSPCQHGSTCTQSRGAFRCDCANTGYSGPRCEDCIYKRTCGDIRESGETKSGMYKICPKNDQIFSVHCNMQSGATVIQHDMKNDTGVQRGQLIGNDPSAVYYHDINYYTTFQNIRDLINVSLTCRQYIRYDCFQSNLLSGVGRYRDINFKGVRWVDSESYIQHYWGGATPESRKCGCGMDGSCAKDALGNTKYCNCDVADATWRHDAGYLNDKSKLPVLQLQVSKGPETNKRSRFTVGYLKCYGAVPLPTKATTTKQTTVATTRMTPIMINGDMFYNTSEGLKPITHLDIDHMGGGGDVSNATFTVEAVQSGTIESLFSKPWLITIIIIGTILCLMLVLMVFLLFRNQIYNIFMKCVYGNHATKPRIEIEDYNRYSTATEEESDWDIYRLSTTFPTSTPEPSYGPTDDDESVSMRVRTLEDLRGKRRFKRLTGWGSRTASAPTVVGSLSKYSISEKDEANCLPNPDVKTGGYDMQMQDEGYHHEFEAVESERAYSTTATDGECDSVMDGSVSGFSHKSSHHSHDSSMKESECSSCSSVRPIPPSANQNGRRAVDDANTKPYRLAFNNESYAVQLPAKINGPNGYQSEPVKTYIPVLPYNGYRQPPVRRGHPGEYGPPMAMVNNTGVRCPRIVAVNRRSGSDGYTNMIKHPTIQERDELSDEELHAAYDTQHNSDGFYELYDHAENASPSSETRLLFDDASSREECVREADEQIKLLKKKVMEKATSADECTTG